MAGILTNLAGNAVSIPSAPATLTAATVNTTTVTLTYGAIRTNGLSLLPLVGSGTNTGDIYDSTGTATNLTYSGTLNPAGGTINITGTFTLNNTYNFNVRARNSAGVSSYITTGTAIAPNFSFTPFSFTPAFSFAPFSFTPVFSFTPFSFTPFSFTPVFSFTPFSFTPSGSFFFAHTAGLVSNNMPLSTVNTNLNTPALLSNSKIMTINGNVDVKDIVIGDTILLLNYDQLTDENYINDPIKIKIDNIYKNKYVEANILQIIKSNTNKHIKINEKLFNLENILLIKRKESYMFMRADFIQNGDYLVNNENNLILVNKVEPVLELTGTRKFITSIAGLTINNESIIHSFNK